MIRIDGNLYHLGWSNGEKRGGPVGKDVAFLGVGERAWKNIIGETRKVKKKLLRSPVVLTPYFMNGKLKRTLPHPGVGVQGR